MPTRTFIFAGGGTGGHLYPGLAIASELERLGSLRGTPVRSLFVCSDRPIDSKILTQEAAEFVPLAARPFGVRPRALARFLRSWGKCVRESRGLIRSEIERAGDRKLVHVVAMGGFVAAPFVQAARVERVPVTMVNLDAVPGKANRLIARRVPRVLTSARLVNRSGEYQRWTEVPPIVRPSVIARDGHVACRARIGLAPDRLTLLVTGGSQGAQSINRLVETLVTRDPEVFRSWQVLHQCGKDEEDRLTQVYQQAGVRAIVRPFVSEMGDWWGAADLCVSRCGAGTVAEAWANGVPAIFLPYPFHRDEHQRHNAAVLVEKHAAILVTDRIDPGQTMSEFERAIMPLLNDRRALDAMKENIRSLGPASGAEQVTRVLLDSSP